VKNKRFWILLGGIALISAAFLLLNFRLAMSSTQAEKLLLTTDMGDNLPVSMRRNKKITIVMVGEGPLVKALQKVLGEKMREAGFGEIELVYELELFYRNPVLVIKVGKPNPAWTPLFAMSKVPVYAGYASDGDTTLIETIEQTHTSVSKKNVAFRYAEYDVKDRSVG
jgi:hypothetical protein